MGTEAIFRAYPLPNNTPPKRVFKVGQADVANAVLAVGRDGGSGKTIEGQTSYTASFYLDQAQVEQGT